MKTGKKTPFSPFPAYKTYKICSATYFDKKIIYLCKKDNCYMPRHRNTLLRMKNVCEIAAKYYEPGRADRCYKEVWRRYVYPVYPCCYRTFLNYIGVPVDAELKKQSAGQMSLPF